MKFIFATKGSCCGGGGSTKLKSTNYTVTQGDAFNSIVRAFDVFYTNYRVQPAEILLTPSELAIIQNELPQSEFSLVNAVLHFRTFPVGSDV